MQTCTNGDFYTQNPQKNPVKYNSARASKKCYHTHLNPKLEKYSTGFVIESLHERNAISEAICTNLQSCQSTHNSELSHANREKPFVLKSCSRFLSHTDASTGWSSNFDNVCTVQQYLTQNSLSEAMLKILN